MVSCLSPLVTVATGSQAFAGLGPPQQPGQVLTVNLKVICDWNLPVRQVIDQPLWAVRG